MFGIGVPELLLILALALIVFGPGKLPEVGKAIGRGLSEFRRAAKDVHEADEQMPVTTHLTQEVKTQAVSKQ